MDERLDRLRKSTDGLHVVGLEEESEVDLWEVDVTAPTVLFLGNEK